jgi:zinc protease
MVKKFQLKNGMKVLFQESHKSPVISVQVWVRTGSADEAKGEEGISHFIEHLVFKGTRKFKVGEIASQIEGAGGELNAYTSFDQTVFYVTISKNFVDIGMQALAEMMGFPSFDPVEIDNEREVVVEEIKRGNDSLGRRASQLLFSTAYQKHPYRIPVIGYEKNVRGWSAKKIVQYYQSRYSPQNMFLVVTGDFDSKEMKVKANQFFGEFKKYKIKNVKRKVEPKQKTSRIRVEKSEFEQSISYFSWKTPAIKHKDIAALDVMAMILGQGDSSRLVHKLRIEAPIVNSVGASVFSTKDPGFFAVSLGFAEKNFSLAIEGIQECLLKIMSEPVRPDELLKAVTNIESENFYSVETVDGLSRKIGDAEFLMKDPQAHEKYLKQIRKVTAKDILTVAKKYLNPVTMTATTLTNGNVKIFESEIKAWLKIFSQNYKRLKPVRASTKPAQLPKLKRASSRNDCASKTTVHELSNGVRVLARPNFDTQVVSIKMAELGGARLENKELLGLAELTSKTWMGGTKTRTESQIYAEIESYAAGISPISGRNSIGLSLDVLSSFEKPARDLYLDILTNSKFPTDVIEREKKIQLQQIKTRNDNPAQLAVRQFMETMFGSHPYGKDALGDEQTIAKIQSKDIQHFWSEHALKKNTTFILSGACDVDSWLESIESATSQLPTGQKFLKSIPVNKPNKSSVVFQKLQKEQSHFIFGYPGLTITDQDRFVLEVIQSILAGQGGRLFIELRDKNSLAYSVSPLKMEGIDGGYFGAYIGCSPDKVAKAFEMMKIEFQKLRDTKVPELEIERARKYLIGRHDIDLQRVSAIAASILYDDIYGIPHDQTFNLAEKYRAIGSEDLMRVAEKIFSQEPVLSLVGPNNPL